LQGVVIDEQDLRRLVLNMGAAALLAGKPDPSERDINLAVAAAGKIDRAVRKRLRWENRETDATLRNAHAGSSAGNPTA